MSRVDYPELTRIQMAAGETTWPVVLYPIGTRYRWAVYRHGHGTHLIKKGTAASKVSVIKAAKAAIATYRKTKVRCKICDDAGCYTCDG